MDVQPPTSSSHPQATDSKPVEKFDAASFATRMSSFDQTCSCCPYGYHIDLDFLRYLDSLYSSDTLKRLKRIRCSKDGSLPRSVETPPPPPPPPPQHAPQVNRTSPTYTIVSENLVTCAATRRGGKEVIVELDISPSNERSTVQSSTESTVVSPNSDSKFRTETELFISNSSGGDSSEHLEPSIRLTEERRVHTSRSVVQAESSYSKRTLERPVHLTLTQPDESIPTSPYRPFSRGSSSSPVDSDASSSISPAVLQAIREQMALSLRRMKELEEQVKVIPALQARILTLVRENQHLAEAVRSSEGIPVRASEVPIRASGSRSLVDAWTQTLESFQSRADFWNTTGGRREVDVNFNRVLEETVAGVAETDEVSTMTEQNGTKSVEGKYYSVAIQCQLPTGGACFKEEMTSVAVDVRPSVISRCVGTDDGFLWHPADNGPSDISTQSSGAATYEQRLAWWLKLGVDKATSVDDNLASDPDVRVEFLEERQHARSHAVQSMTVDRVQLAAPWTPTGESLGEAVLNEDNIAVQRNVDFEKRLYEDSVEEEVLSFSDRRSFEFEAAIAKAETSLLQSDDINRLSSVKSDGADSVDEDVVLVEKAVGGCDKLRLEREMALLEESDVGWKREHLFATTEGVCLEKESDRSGRRDSFGLEMSRVVTAGEISDTVKEGETNDEGISDTGEEVQAKDEETSNAGEEAEKKEEEIPEAAGKPGNTRGGEGSIDSRAAVNDKDEEVLGEHEEAEIKPENEDKPIGEAVGSEDRSTKTEFILIGDQIVRSPVLESKRGTMSLETNLEVLLEQDVEKEEEQDVSVEMSLVNEKQEQVCEGNPVLIVDTTKSDMISVVMSAQRTVTASEETALSRLEAGSEEVSEARNEAEYEDEGISDTGEDAEAKNEDISDVGKVDKERVNDNEEITAAGEETRSKDTEIVDLHAAVANKDGHVLGEDQEAENKAKEAESENNKDETKCEDKELLDERESKEVLRRGRFLNEDTLDTFTDSEKEGGEDILDTDSDMTRTDEESGGSYEIDVRVADEDIVFTIETGQVNNSTSTSKRNQLEVLVETHEEIVAREGDSEVENTSKLIGEAVVAMDTIGVTMKTEVTNTRKVTDNSEIDELEWERSPVDAVVESAGVGENVLKSIEVVADTDVQCVHVEVGSEVVGTSRSLVAGEERVVINKVSEQNESDIKVLEVKVSEEKVSEQNESEVKVPGVNVSEEKVSEQNEFEVKVSEQNESGVKVSEQNESGVKVSEQNESGVKVPEVKVSKENESKENESEVKVSKVQVSDVKVSEEKIYEEKVSEENESDVKVPEVKASEVKVSQEKVSEQNESEVKVPGINVSEEKVFEQNESQVTVHKVKVSKEKVSKENESEEMVSEVRVSEEGVSEVKVSEAKESEAKVPEEMESEAKVLQEKESGVRGSEEMESEKREYEVKVLEEKISDVRVSKKIVSEEIDSKAKEYEEMESKVKVSGQMESEVKASEEMESEVRVSKEKESEISEPQEKESEVEVAEEKESEVELAEEKKSEVEVAGEKESEVEAAEEKESEVEAAEEKKSEVEVAEEKEVEVEEAEEKESEISEPQEHESEVEVAEEKESEVEVAEEKKSEVEVAGEKKSEIEVAEEKESEVEVAEEKESEVEVAEEKEFEVEEAEEKESEVEVAEEKESEVMVAEEKESEVEAAGEKESEVEVAEEKKSEVEAAEEKKSEVEVAEEKEVEVEEAEEKESEISEPQEHESEVEVAEEKESEVEVAEEKKSEVEVAGEKKSEIEVAEEKESEVEVAEEKESEVEVAEEKEFEVEEAEEKESEVEVAEEKESEVMVAEEKESEVEAAEEKESEVELAEEKKSEVEAAEEMASDGWELVEQLSDAKALSTEESYMMESDEKETITKQVETKESEEWEMVDKESDRTETSGELSELVESSEAGSKKVIELSHTTDTPHHTIMPSIDHVETISALDGCNNRHHESIIVSKAELCQLANTEHELENSSAGDTLDQRSGEPEAGLLDAGGELVRGFPLDEEVTESLVLCENVEQTSLELGTDNMQLVSRKTKRNETAQSIEPDENIVLDSSLEPDENIELDTSVEPDNNIVLDTRVEPEKSTMPKTGMEPTKVIVSHINMEPDESAVRGTCVEPGYHAMPSEIMGPLETKRAETAEMFIETSPTETSYISSEHQSIDFCSTESTSTKRVIITETRIERRRADHHVSSQGSSQKSRAVGSDELQNDGPPPEEEDEYAMVGMKSDSLIPSSSDSQSADDSQRTADSIVVRPDVLAACAVYAEYLRDPTVAVDSDNVVSCVDFLRNHWFDLSGRKTSDASLVQFHLDEYLKFGTSLAQALINMADSDGNTAMHYSVSYGNMDVIEVLLNTGLCNVDKQNKAGYTSIMLASLLLVDLDQHEPLVFRLFHSGDVNSTSATSGQTSLMLASSHGRSEMVSLLLESGAEINLQDEDGSTALMCATEHGHNEVIRTLLNHPLCDSTISDVDGSTALSIAMEEGHHDIGVFLYAHMKAIDDRLLEDD